MAVGQAFTQPVLSLRHYREVPAARQTSCGRSTKGLCPLNPEVYRFVPQGLATSISSVSMQQKRAIPYGTAPSEASRRSGRTSALPYPPLLVSTVYHPLALFSSLLNSIVLDTGSTLRLSSEDTGIFPGDVEKEKKDHRDSAMKAIYRRRAARHAKNKDYLYDRPCLRQ